MKKLFSILLALVMSFGLLTACDNGATPDNGGTSNGGQTTDDGSGGGSGGESSGGETEETTYTVSVTCGDGGTYALSSAGPYHKGDEVTLTLLPFSGYAVQSVTLNGESVAFTDNSCTFTVNAATSIQIVFGKRTAYTVDVTCGEGGSYTLSPDKSVYYAGDEVTLTVTHRRSYAFGDVTLNGNAVTLSEDGTYSFTVEGNVAIDIAFEEIITHTLNVACGSGGTYSLSASGPYADGQEVTLTVYPNAGMKVGSVTVNGEEVTLINDAYTFNVTEDTQITIAFEQKEEGEADTYDVFVTCGSEGSYTLSPEGPYTRGTEVTLTVTPQDGYYVSSFTVDGTETTLTNGKYVFAITKDVVFAVKFGESLFSADLTGRWIPLTGAGTFGYALTLKGESVVFSETEDAAQEYPLSVLGNGRYSFTVTDQDGVKTVFTFSFRQVAIGAKLLVLSHTENGETVETHYLLDGIDYYTFAFPTILVGSWAPAIGGAGTPIEITETGIYYGVSPAIVLSFNAETYETVLLEGTLTYTQSSDNLVLTPSDPDSEAVSYHREIPSGPVLVPEHAGTYSNSEHTVVIDAEGNFSFDGTVRTLTYDEETKAYTFRASREYTVLFNSTSMEVFNAAANEDWTLRKIEEDMAQYTLTVTYSGEQGTVSCSPKNAENKYWAGESVTLTVTANTASGYEVDKITVNGVDRTLSSAGTITVTMDTDTAVVITFKEFTEESLLSEKYIGVYTGSPVITVTITASGVTVKWGSGSTTFTVDQITMTGTNTYTLQNMTERRKFTIKINDDGSMTLGDPNWAINGGNYKLTKQSS